MVTCANFVLVKDDVAELGAAKHMAISVEDYEMEMLAVLAGYYMNEGQDPQA